tara:strand:+ start:217 stop:972 length:756 start_codon:yes stop_codon:yes gene_type:complete
MANKKERFVDRDRLKKIIIFIKKLKINSIDLQKITDDINSSHSLVNEALTHTSANSLINHERLEFLGDAVLRLAASEFIEKNYPSMKVGARSSLRSHLVSDEWLTKVGKEIEIEQIIEKGPKASKDISAKATLQAECTEALIGAIYESIQDLKPIHEWLNPFWHEESNAVLANPDKYNSKSALQEWSQAKGEPLPEYIIKEISKEHNNPKRFFCEVLLDGKSIGQGWGKSRKEAEKEAAQLALEALKNESS